MSLKVPSRHLLEPNLDEIWLNTAYQKASERIDMLIEKAWKKDEYGNNSSNDWRGVSLYHILIWFSYFIYRDRRRRVFEGDTCLSEKIKDKYKLECVLENLKCLGISHNEDLNGFFKELLDEIGLDLNLSCDEEKCCQGIGQMIISSDNLCKSFIIGNCKDLDLTDPIYGEFAPCEFPTQEFSLSQGVEENCN